MDLFDILKIPKESSETDIKKAYRKLAKKWHPDRNKKKNAKEKFQQINSAYKILINRLDGEVYHVRSTEPSTSKTLLENFDKYEMELAFGYKCKSQEMKF